MCVCVGGGGGGGVCPCVRVDGCLCVQVVYVVHVTS